MKKKYIWTCSLLVCILLLCVGCSTKRKNIEEVEKCTETPSDVLSERTENTPGVSPFIEEQQTNVLPSQEREKQQQSLFRLSDDMQVTVEKSGKVIMQRAKVLGEEFSLTINLEKWEENTSLEQIVTCTKVFWYCYPQMYARFAVSDTPKNVTFVVQNEDYEIAYTMDDTVYLHDQWLKSWPDDYDCLTHEFTHVIQGGWEEEFVPTYEEDTYMIERFADYCRYIYCYNDGYYNEKEWELQTPDGENSYASSVRFWVWLDYTYSNNDKDILKKICQAIGECEAWASTEYWQEDGIAWEQVFDGTKASGKTMTQLWEEYIGTDFAYRNACSEGLGIKSDLDQTYQVRKAIKNRFCRK